MTQISIRIDDETSSYLQIAAKKLHVKRSDIIRMALNDFLKKSGISGEDDELSLYDRLKPFIGVTDSGIPDLSTNPKHLAKRMKKRKQKMKSYVLLDTGPWVAAIDSGDNKYKLCTSFIKQFKGHFLTTYPVLTEVLYLLNSDIRSQKACFEWVRCGAVKFVHLEQDMLDRSESLMIKYKDTPMDFADATLVALAEKTGIHHVFTLDRKGFTTFKIQGKKNFEISPT